MGSLGASTEPTVPLDLQQDVLRVVIAPDSFKGSLAADAVAAAIAAGWRSVRPDDEILLLPQADGGEGTIDILAAAIPGAVRRSAGFVTGPDHRPVEAGWLQLPDGTAVVEVAETSGLPLMESLDPLHATSRGLGEVISAALDAGATSLVIGLGGSATTDAAAGALRALGLRIADSSGADVAEGGVGLGGAVSVDRSQLRSPPVGGVRLLSDVTAPLLGERGAAAVFGPQKGADAVGVAALDSALARFAALLGGDPEVAGAGAAGGIGYGFAAAWGGRIESGAVAIAELTGLSRGLTDADVVITGEGRFDATSMIGKVVGYVLSLADQGSVRPVVVAGTIVAEPVTPAGQRTRSVSLVDIAGSLQGALEDPKRWLRLAGATVARSTTTQR